MREEMIEDTYAEAFEGIVVRVVVTADDEATLRSAAESSTSTPSIVIGRTEGGIERCLSTTQTPDKRNGVILQFWGGLDPTKPFSDSLRKFEIELSYRVRQDILVKPFTSLFDASVRPGGKIDMMERVGHCGDGYEWTEKRYGRNVIVVPTMVPDFIVERHVGFTHGIMGANFWIFCHTKQALREAGNKALEAIHQVEGVVTPFGICSAGSKVETHFPWIGPTTNHEYCPSLKRSLGKASKVPVGINYIPEIVINGIDLKVVKTAMKAGIEAALSVEGVNKIAAGNYAGKLGRYKISLRELFR